MDTSSRGLNPVTLLSQQDIAVDDADLYLSVVEGSPTPVGPFLTEDAICRLYEVGRRRPDDADSDIDDAHESEDDDDDWAGDEVSR